MTGTNASPSGLSALRQFVGRRKPTEQCALCAATVPEEHPHLFESATAKVICACGPCSFLFGQSERYRLISREVRRLSSFRFDDALWQSLAVPIDLVFFSRSSRNQAWNAVYPSPAGPMQSPIDDETWNDFAVLEASLQTLQPDIEALLVNRLNGARRYFIAPIDECYKLTGLVRRHWRGFSGGDEAWKAIEHFFESLERRVVSPGGPHA